MEQVIITKKMVRDEPDSTRRAELEALRQRQEYRAKQRKQPRNNAPSQRMQNPPEKWASSSIVEQNTNLKTREDAKEIKIASKLAVMRKEFEEKAFKLWMHDTQGRTAAEIYRDLQLSAIMDLRGR